MKHSNETLAARLLDVIEQDILPLTERGVEAGDKVFGAAVLRCDDLSLVVAATNEEHSSACPLWHGEMTVLREYHRLAERPPAEECLLLSTHEPCSMCASAIAWCGFKRVFFLFDYQDTEKAFAIPHDIRMLRSLFTPAAGLNHSNEFFDATAMALLPLDSARVAHIRQCYDNLSDTYQTAKEHNNIPLK